LRAERTYTRNRYQAAQAISRLSACPTRGDLNLKEIRLIGLVGPTFHHTS